MRFVLGIRWWKSACNVLSHKQARKALNIKNQFEMQQRRIEELEVNLWLLILFRFSLNTSVQGAVASLRTDTIELLKHGGSISVEEMQRRIKEEERRRQLVHLHSQIASDESLWGYFTM